MAGHATLRLAVSCVQYLPTCAAKLSLPLVPSQNKIKGLLDRLPDLLIGELVNSVLSPTMPIDSYPKCTCSVQQLGTPSSAVNRPSTTSEHGIEFDRDDLEGL